MYFIILFIFPEHTNSKGLISLAPSSVAAFWGKTKQKKAQANCNVWTGCQVRSDDEKRKWRFCLLGETHRNWHSAEQTLAAFPPPLYSPSKLLFHEWSWRIKASHWLSSRPIRAVPGLGLKAIHKSSSLTLFLSKPCNTIMSFSISMLLPHL